MEITESMSIPAASKPTRISCEERTVSTEKETESSFLSLADLPFSLTDHVNSGTRANLAPLSNMSIRIFGTGSAPLGVSWNKTGVDELSPEGLEHWSS